MERSWMPRLASLPARDSPSSHTRAGDGVAPVSLIGKLAARLREEAAPLVRLQGLVRGHLPAARQWVDEHWEALSRPGRDDAYRAQAGEAEDLAQVLAYLLAQRSEKGSEEMAFPGVACEEVTNLSGEQVVRLLRVIMRALCT